MAWEHTMDVGGGVQRIEMTERETPVFGGAEFGTAGTYERLHRTVFGELDRTHLLNASIVNLDRAPRNARGKVEYQSNFHILKPLDLRRPLIAIPGHASGSSGYSGVGLHQWRSEIKSKEGRLPT